MSPERTAVPTVRDLIALLEEMFPPDLAESWDRVGLVTGDPDAAVTTILLALDPTLAVIDDAVAAGAEVLITHHPLLLRGVTSIAPTTAKGSALVTAVRAGLAMYCAHTNADSARPGVSDALAAACGLASTQPLVAATVEDDGPAGVGLGRVGDLAEPITLAEFARRLAGALPPTVSGLRVAGPADAQVRRVAVVGGSGDDQFQRARQVGADVYVTADLRHHPVLEERELSALGDGRPYLVDTGHWAGESLWLDSLAGRLRDRFARAGITVGVQVSTRRTEPWDFVVPTGTGTVDNGIGE